jgi:CheY-like chemotaxis protein
LTSRNGVEALKTIEENPDINLVVLDLNMPVMNGYEAALKIKSIHPQALIVAMTAEVTPGVKEKCAQAGMDNYISKPFESEQLVKFIRSLLSDIEPHLTFEVAAIDVAKGIRQMGDNADLYRLVVREFHSENIDIAQKTEDAILSKNYSEARQHLHKIKGSADGIGATILSEAILALHKAIIDNDEMSISTALESFKIAVSKTLKFIENNYLQNDKQG